VHSSSPWIRRSWVGARRISTSAHCRLSVDMASRNTHLILAPSRSFGIDLDQPRVVPKPSAALARFVPSRRYLGNIPAPFAEICDPQSPEPPLRHSSISTQTRGLSWDHIATLRQRTSLPIVLKGILHPDDARRAVELGIDAMIVSNHGGRQVDNAIASLDALIAVRDAVGAQPTILFDSSIRSGTDVLIALALGANACLIGRPYVYGLAIGGADGVRQVIENIVAELDLTMGLLGVQNIQDLSRDLLANGHNSVGAAS